MLLWILFALLTVVAALAVLLPLARKRPVDASEAEHDLAVYRDQLAELEREKASLETALRRLSEI